jgi:hypothetical protein
LNFAQTKELETRIAKRAMELLEKVDKDETADQLFHSLNSVDVTELWISLCGMERNGGTGYAVAKAVGFDDEGGGSEQKATSPHILICDTQSCWVQLFAKRCTDFIP